ncbi:FimV/HubP family polar landmark protein [Shewanella sp. HN-41]|uniref:FimV/HubP family polar landmark protein n=1 Tax=Shewanella sp. HN-41 TaxID=327275 RepID=UPI0005665C52|nr:FimV/HubP family polar landmark protein [Shewanella sp. HN-41]
MKFRTSYLVGLMATVLAVSSTTYFIDPAVAADTPKVKPLKIMGPDGQIRQLNHQYGPTTSKDTFWSIAQKVRPDPSVSVYQVMAAVFDANPHAFNSDNYNSLERGMILLIPSKEVMLAIPNSLAIARAERDDKQARSAAKATTKPAVKPTVKAPTPVVVAPVAEVTPKAEVKMQAVKTEPASTQTATTTEPKMLSSDANARLEAAESKNLSLTDELARTQDQLSVRNTDVEALKAKVEELNQQIAMLEETLQVTKQQNQALKADVEAAQSPVTAEPETPKEPDDLWRTLMESPLLLVAAAVIPALLILFLVFWALRRKRNKERLELETQQAAMAAGGAGMATGTSVLAMDDDLDDMAVHLDTDHADSIDSLLDSGSVSLQPEQDMVDIHEQMDMAADMFIDQGGVAPEPQFEEEEGQSLDDLWAEAMGDQEEAFAEEKNKSDNILEEEDLDALLANLGSDDGAEQSQDETNALADNLAEEWVDVDDLADIEMPSDTNVTQPSSDDDLSTAIAAELEADTELDGLNVQDNLDIDALLADFDKPAEVQTEPDLGDEIAAELDDELTALGVEDTDDIDALLADFDKPAAPEPDLGDAIAAELDPELDAIGIAETDDIDALLAGFDTSAAKPSDVAEDVVGTIVVAPEAELDPLLPEADEELDHLLVAEREASLPEDLSTTENDLDALLAEFDVPEQVEADADDFNFDMETALSDTAKPADEDELLKGIGVATAIDGSEDTTALAQTINKENAALDEVVFSGFDADEDVDDLAVSAAAAKVAAAAKERESSFFNDLKANKSKDPHVLDWDTELDFAPAPKVELTPSVDVSAPANTDAVATKPGSLAGTEKRDLKATETKVELSSAEDSLSDDFDLGADLDLSADVDLSDDSVLAAFSANADLDDDDVLATEDSFSLDDDHTLTVDEALAALDAQESRKSKPFVADHDLTSFQNEHGFIDIDKLLNDAEQDSQEVDLYPDVDVEMSDVGSLIGDAAMIDVDDEENSVNAKLDLARAYIEIDDSDSAKALLKEVQIDGNARQQDEAAKLLKEIG